MVCAIGGCVGTPELPGSLVAMVPHRFALSRAPEPALSTRIAVAIGVPAGKPVAGAAMTGVGGAEAPDAAGTPWVFASPMPAGGSPGGAESGPLGAQPGTSPTPAGDAPAPMPDAALPDAPAGSCDGQVRGSWPEGPGPALPGARVRLFLTSGEYEAMTDAEGRFVLAHGGGSGELVVSAPGFATSQLVGWDGMPGLTLHLAAAARPLAAALVTLPVAGRVVDEEGVAVAGAEVIGSDGARTTFGPLVTGPDGRFAGFAMSGGGTAAEVAVWACSRALDGTPIGLGLAVGVPLGATASATVVVMRPPVGVLSISPTGPAGDRQVVLAAEAPNGASLVLRAWAPGEPLGDCPFFEVPDGRIAASVLVESLGGDARSEWRDTVPAPGLDAPALLAYPGTVVLGEGGPLDGVPLRWGAVAGAEAYRLALQVAGQASPAWEALTPWAHLSPRGIAGVAADVLEVAAVAGPGAGSRRLAGGDGGMRRLRWPGEGPGDRKSVRRVRLGAQAAG